MVRNSLAAYHKEMDPEIENVFKYRKTHNDGVFDVYTPKCGRRGSPASSPACRTPTAAAGSSAITAGWPLYGVDRLIEEKRRSHDEADYNVMDSRATLR